jgi:hypothetical protein
MHTSWGNKPGLAVTCCAREALNSSLQQLGWPAQARQQASGGLPGAGRGSDVVPGRELLLCRPQLGRDVESFINSANDEVLLLIQIETKESYEDIEQVCRRPGQQGTTTGTSRASDGLAFHGHNWPDWPSGCGLDRTSQRGVNCTLNIVQSRAMHP